MLLLVAMATIVSGVAYYYLYLEPSGGRAFSSASSYHGSSSQPSVRTTSGDALRNVVVTVSYRVINDPRVIAVAREFIEAHLPVPASLDKRPMVNWASANISVLEVVVRLTNNGTKPIYYVTNFLCGVDYGSTVGNGGRYEPIAWRVRSPIAVPEITVERGAVFPIVVARTLDLRYELVAANSSIANKYYYIVTKPFEGKIKIKATICSKPFSNECKVVVKETRVILQR